MVDVNLPQHRQLYELLRKHIINGMYKEGDLLPSENELCNLHQVTRPTVRQALSQLVSDGYIKKQQGKGSIVRALPKGIGILSIQGTTIGVGPHNLQTKMIAKPLLDRWPVNFFFDLKSHEVEVGCIRLERQRIVDGNPVLYEISYLPNVNIPRFTQKSFENRSLFEVLRSSYQIEVLGGSQRIRAISANKKISAYLSVKEGAAILCLQRILETNKVGFRYFSEIYCNTSDFYLEGTF
jgi:GntR family transcriptional regulator/GntR family frlABCD operon transcriptional regulator